jgi:mono/diheme cytochrome c family protein
VGGCAPERKGSTGFRLPDGDPAAGRRAFLANRCNACHTVAGEDFQAPVVEPPVGVELGGRIPYARTDGELVTSILNPSHRIAWSEHPERLSSARLSRMGDFSESLSARDVVDLAAYLQSRYKVVPPAYHRW